MPIKAPAKVPKKATREIATDTTEKTATMPASRNAEASAHRITKPQEKSVKQHAKNPAAMKKNVKTGTAKPAFGSEMGMIDGPPVSYCEADRREHGTYLRCGAGAIYASDKALQKLGIQGQTSIVTDSAALRMRGPARMTGDTNRKTAKVMKKPTLNYNSVIRNEARMILQGLNDLYERICAPPFDMEPKLDDVGEHVARAIDGLLDFTVAGREYINPDPSVNFRRDFWEGDGIGNWICFKPTWFPDGRFSEGDIVTFQSSLRALKAEGKVVCLHR